jgi:hypothetical protein
MLRLFFKVWRISPFWAPLKLVDVTHVTVKILEAKYTSTRLLDEKKSREGTSG